MTQPSLQELMQLDDDALVREFWLLIDAFMKQHSHVDRRGQINPREILRDLYPQERIGYTHWEPLLERLGDAMATLVERGFIWFHSRDQGGIGHQSIDRYELTPKGRAASADDVTSGWPSGRGLLERFPEHQNWDETMGAYFRMAVQTYEGRLFEPTVFLLGGAAERLLDLIEAGTEHLLPATKDKRRDASKRAQRLIAFFREKNATHTAELLAVIGEVLRWNRNDVGHPKATPPIVSPSTVLATLCCFSDYVRRTLDAAHAMAGTPPVRNSSG